VNRVYGGDVFSGKRSLRETAGFNSRRQQASSAAQIVGSFEDAAFRNHGFLATPLATAVPEPGTLTLFGVGVLSVVGYRWLRGKQTEQLSLMKTGTP